jgi:hypothetical protein
MPTPAKCRHRDEAPLMYHGYDNVLAVNDYYPSETRWKRNSNYKILTYNSN